MLYVLMLLGLVGVALVVLASISTTMIEQSHWSVTYAEAENLAASGWAWSRHNAPKLADLAAGSSMKLNTQSLKIRDSVCGIAMIKNGQNDTELAVDISCPYKDKQYKCSFVYHLR